VGALWTYNSEVDRWYSSPEAAPESALPPHDIGPVPTDGYLQAAPRMAGRVTLIQSKVRDHGAQGIRANSLSS
jgi:hypothetical protein